MAGSKVGGQNLRITMINRYGSEEAWKAAMSELGKKGGSRPTTGGFKGDPELARRAAYASARIRRNRSKQKKGFEAHRTSGAVNE